MIPPIRLDRQALEIRGLIAACDRLLATEAEVLAMPKEQRDWFTSKPGHGDCFTVARELKKILESKAEAAQ